jgi:hypothetical protein
MLVLSEIKKEKNNNFLVDHQNFFPEFFQTSAGIMLLSLRMSVPSPRLQIFARTFL